MKTFEVVLKRPNKKEELTLSEKIAKIDPEKVISLKNKYGVFWTGKAKYVFSSVTKKAWKSTDTDVIL